MGFAGIVLMILLFEVFARGALPRLSGHLSRLETDRRAAMSLTEADRRPSVMFVGNSLLIHSLRRDVVGAALGGKYQVAFYPIENTTFWDWFYGLRRMFAEGLNADVVVLCLNGRQLASDATSGMFFARDLMSLGDFFSVVEATDLHRMEASDYAFAHFSEWLGMRANFRNAFLEMWLPGAAEMAPRLIVPASNADREALDIESAVRSRLTLMSQMLEQHGSKFILLVPPSLEKDSQLVSAAAMHEDVPFVAPQLQAADPASRYSDGFHLNEVGSSEFTATAVPLLESALSEVLPNFRSE